MARPPGSDVNRTHSACSPASISKNAEPRKEIPLLFQKYLAIITAKKPKSSTIAAFSTQWEGKEVCAVGLYCLYSLPPGLWSQPVGGPAGLLPDAWADAGGQGDAPFLGGAGLGRTGRQWGRFFLRLYPRLPVLPECGHQLSWAGEETDASALRKMMEALIAQGAENIDLVTPTQFLPEILPALTPNAGSRGV